MSCAGHLGEAPLSIALRYISTSVDGRHTGTASGFNGAIARTGGLIATALASAVIAEAVPGWRMRSTRLRSWRRSLRWLRGWWRSRL